MALIFLFMYAPIVTLIVLSFNRANRARWGGFHVQVVYQPVSAIPRS